MATQQTPNRGYPYPTTSETPNVPRDLEALATAVDADVTSLVPVGTIIAYGGSDTPSGWLLCNGSSFSSAVYPQLFAKLGVTTTPNLVDRFIKGSTTAHDTGGSKTITISNMPSHDHGGLTGTMSANATHSHSGSTSSDGSHTHAANWGERANVFAAGNSGLYSHYTVSGSGTTSPSTSHSHTFGTSTADINHVHGVSPQGGGADYEPKFYTVRYLIKAA